MFEVNEFPSHYILRRWTRDAVPNLSSQHDFTSNQVSDDIEDPNDIIKEIMFSTEYVVNKLSKNMEELRLFRENIKQFVSKADDYHFPNAPVSKHDKYAQLTKMSQPSSSDRAVRVPIGVKTKGSGSRKRLISEHEKAKSQAKLQSKTRVCQCCNESGHNIRTCTKKNENPVPLQSGSSQVDTLEKH